MESDFSPLESAISYKFLMFQKIPKNKALFCAFSIQVHENAHYQSLPMLASLTKGQIARRRRQTPRKLKFAFPLLRGRSLAADGKPLAN